MRQDLGLTYPVLVDAEGAAMKAYGIVNEESGGKIPHPTVVVVDEEGVVSFFHLDENYRQRPPPETVIEAVQEAGGAE